MILVAVAGPVTNLELATAAALSIHLLPYAPAGAAAWLAQNSRHSSELSRVAAAHLEPYAMMILIALIFLLPVIGMRMGVDLNKSFSVAFSG